MAYRRTPAVQARLDRQRAAIVAATVALLSERGYAGCSVAAVASRAGIASGTVYTHFANKGELVAEVFRTVVTREVEAVRAAVAVHTVASARIQAVIETFAGRALKSPRLAYALLAEPVEPVVESLRVQFRVAFRDIVGEAVAAGVSAGEFAPQNPTVVAAALVGAIGEALVGPLSAADGISAPDPDTVPTLIRFSARALGARDASYA